MRWRRRKKAMDAAQVFEWLESSYDEWEEYRVRYHRGQNPQLSETASFYKDAFAVTHSPGIASVKLDHEMVGMGEEQRCPVCSLSKEVIVIE